MISIMLKRVSRLFAAAPLRVLEADEVLFRQGDPVEHMFLATTGSMLLERGMADGRVLCFQRAVAGQILAEASLYAAAYHCGCRASAKSGVRVLSKAHFAALLHQDADLIEAWATHLAETVQRTRMLSEIRTLRRVSDRLDAWLGLYGKLPPRGQWQTVADELAVSREALYRELAKRRAGGACAGTPVGSEPGNSSQKTGA